MSVTGRWSENHVADHRWSDQGLNESWHKHNIQYICRTHTTKIGVTVTGTKNDKKQTNDNYKIRTCEGEPNRYLNVRIQVCRLNHSAKLSDYVIAEGHPESWLMRGLLLVVRLKI